jgi:transcriptional regulator with XRE-family HTH domain
MLQTVQERLKFALDHAGCSAREVDRLAGLTPGHALLIASGHKSNAKSRTFSALAVVLGISLDWVLLKRGRTPRPERIHAAVHRAAEDPKRVLTQIERAFGVERKAGRRRSSAKVSSTSSPAPTPRRRRARGCALPATEARPS